MRARLGLIADQDGALHMIEALMAAFLMLSALACISAVPCGQAGSNSGDLRLMASDLLRVLQQREDSPGHPGLALALSTPDEWEQLSSALGTDLRSYLPAGYHAFLRTPYGATGDYPPDGCSMHVQPFMAYREDAAEIIDCSLIVWRL